MAAAGLYPFVLAIHICAVLISGALFVIRRAAGWLGATWPDNKKLKRMTYVVDSILLSAALLLVANYIVLGIVSGRKQIPVLYRGLAFVLALVVFLNILGIAITHNPMGWWSLLKKAAQLR